MVSLTSFARHLVGFIALNLRLRELLDPSGPLQEKSQPVSYEEWQQKSKMLDSELKQLEIYWAARLGTAK